MSLSIRIASIGLTFGNVNEYVPSVGSMNRSFLEFNRSLSPLNMLLTISPYEPDKVLLTRNLSFRIDSIEVKNKAIA